MGHEQAVARARPSSCTPPVVETEPDVHPQRAQQTTPAQVLVVNAPSDPWAWARSEQSKRSFKQSNQTGHSHSPLAYFPLALLAHPHKSKSRYKARYADSKALPSRPGRVTVKDQAIKEETRNPRCTRHGTGIDIRTVVYLKQAADSPCS